MTTLFHTYFLHSFSPSFPSSLSLSYLSSTFFFRLLLLVLVSSYGFCTAREIGKNSTSALRPTRHVMFDTLNRWRNNDILSKEFRRESNFRGDHCQCERIQNTGCREACEALKSTNEINQLQEFASAVIRCPNEQIWDCAYVSQSVFRSLQSWPGRVCCNKSFQALCSSACFSAHSKSDLRPGCHPVKDAQLFECVDRMTLSQQCCSIDKSVTPSCQVLCQNLYLTNTLNSHEQLQTFVQHCSVKNQAMVLCVLAQAKPAHLRNINEYLPCCEKGESRECINTCLSSLMLLNTDDEKIDVVIKKCGEPSPMVPIWKCFLQLGLTKNKTSPSIIDGAKLQCCRKALSSECRNLCKKTYSSLWGDSSKAFHATCLTPIQSLLRPMESPLQMCIKQVDEPCTLGCNGLNFCTNFNNRPVEMFRNCNAKADSAAKRELHHWQKGDIILPQMRIPVKDIKNCEYEMWKTIACALQVKPCQGQPAPLSICREDCDYILRKCINYKHLPDAKNVSILCNQLPSHLDNGHSCINIRKFSRPSPHTSSSKELTKPCYPNPCNKSEICQINRRKCKHPDNCKPYSCKPACSVGEVSVLKIPRGSYVVLPSNINMSCSKVCHCTHKHNIDHCQPLPCLINYNSSSSSSNVKTQNIAFMSHCNFCTCHSKKTICTKRQCVTAKDKLQQTYTGLPCNCQPRYFPVCGINGKTYPNRCLAFCAGLKEIQFRFGNCTALDPCKKADCKSDEKCIPRLRACLSFEHRSCPQYVCVPTKSGCSHNHEHFCDTLDEEFSNICQLNGHGRDLAYWGHCQENCQNNGVVCGHNGETYSSECKAFAHRTTVDYKGFCRKVGRLSLQDQQNSHCYHISCPEIHPKSCKPITPPVACCPICAAELRVLFSTSLADDALKVADIKPITSIDIAEKLSDLLTVPQCDVFAYLSLEGDLVVLIAPVTKHPTELQVEACNQEARRFHHLIETGSPTLMSHLTLMPLLNALIRTPVVMPIGAASYTNFPSVSLMMWATLVFVLTVGNS
ncbi:reversion-inducing cysteine-rich protein with Kazal motifs-like [Argonauta hians]